MGPRFLFQSKWNFLNLLLRHKFYSMIEKENLFDRGPKTGEGVCVCVCKRIMNVIGK